MTQFDAEVTSDDKLWALLAYVLSPLIPILIMVMEDKKNRPFLKAHNAQALILGIIAIITSSLCVGILVWFYMIYLGFQAYQGKTVEVPLITKFVKDQGWA
ncbi:MAG: hypothetical protein CO094_07135 [Anaerolineae bacterium CG_4_9_14_3_um_filter_57_17]|nr:hypothetical protein [bacterium]NCT21294.1 hypothetical protein [bacterium]OIO84850.1 MAG: hypothetical protein AUK01_08540 [Anaerolineae bacterium CG2_30_57_67]PJB66422.1 MAG: hypothetical protein CO094_07135 [Anaerolineae bacterium CG_4_9_14_3_um_filter_57_17]